MYTPPFLAGASKRTILGVAASDPVKALVVFGVGFWDENVLDLVRVEETVSVVVDFVVRRHECVVDDIIGIQYRRIHVVDVQGHPRKAFRGGSGRVTLLSRHRLGAEQAAHLLGLDRSRGGPQGPEKRSNNLHRGVGRLCGWLGDLYAAKALFSTIAFVVL